MQGKPVSASRYSTHYEPLPADANNDGSVFGGHIMRLVDSAGFFSAIRHCRNRVVTAHASITFRAPVKMGDIIMMHSSVNAVWTTSMEVGIRLEAEHPYTGEVRHVGTAYLTFVSVDENGKPKPVPPLILETDEDRRRMLDATRRMALSRMEQARDNSAMSGLGLTALAGSYAICKLPVGQPLPQLCTLPPSAFLCLVASDTEQSLILDETAALALEAAQSGLEIARGFCCLKVDEAGSLHKTGLIASLSSLLAASQVPVLTVTSFQTVYILVEEALLGKAVERLRGAGHRVNE